MARLKNKDGLSRQQRINQISVTSEMKLMDDRLPIMEQRMAFYYQFINYYNLQNKKEGSFDQIISNSIFRVTSNIRLFNPQKEEDEFLSLLNNNFYATRIKEERLIGQIVKLVTLFDSWLRVTSYFSIHDYELTLHHDLVNQVVVNLSRTTSQLFSHIGKNFKKFTLPELSTIWETEKRHSDLDNPLRFYKSAFYKFLNSILFLQKNISLYEKEVYTSGYIDPAIAVMIAFLQNHNKIINQFNDRWKGYCQFYLDKILKARPSQAIPDSTVLQIKKNVEKEWLEITPGTTFVAREKVKFFTTEPLIVNDIELKSVLGLYEEEDKIIEPAAWFGHVTALKKVDLSSLIDAPVGEGTAYPLFDQKGKKSDSNTPSMAEYTSVGLMVQSWSLLLSEGVRNINLKLIFTNETLTTYQRLIAKIHARWGEGESDIAYKLLNEIFYINVTTAEGWRNIDSYTTKIITDSDIQTLEISFSVGESFPPICPLETERTTPPSVQLLLNRNAWFFPYSWMKDFEFSAVKITTEASGLSNIQLYSELGQLDTTMPFYPFGMLPSRGAWMVFGSHEMAVKKIKTVDIKIKWANLPTDSSGFADYYFEYQKEIDNCSFMVEPEILKNRKWVPTQGKKGYYLFNTDVGDEAGTTLSKAPLSSESLFKGIAPNDFVRQKIGKEEFSYNMFATNGFFRLRLTSPEIGFGHQHYHRILSNVLMQNARSKKYVKAPNPPFAPQAEFITLNYIAEDEISIMRASEGFGEALYHLHPFGQSFLNIFATRKPFRGIPDFESKGNLLFGFDHVNGSETIRLYFGLQPQQKEIDRNNFPQITWFYGDGFHWSLLPPKNIIKDETLNLLLNGIIEIKIPHPIPEKATSMRNLFWLRAAILMNMENISDVNGFYLHAVKVERMITSDSQSLQDLNALPSGQISSSEKHIAGLAGVVQLVQTSGGRVAEDETSMRVRLSERIAHRNRAVTARDFEKIVLENFTSVRKVKCFPCIDSKQNRPGVVTIAIIPETERQVRLPMSSGQLLIAVEDFLKNYTSRSVIIDAINPSYEFLQIRCKIRMHTTRSEGYYLRLLNREINHYIAYWEAEGEAPVFGNSVSLIELVNFIRSREYILQVKNFSVLHLREKEELLYELVETGEFEKAETGENDLKETIKILLNNREIKIKELKPITPSKPWAILIPMESHLLVAEWEDQIEKAGINELQIGNTFVIN